MMSAYWTAVRHGKAEYWYRASGAFITIFRHQGQLPFRLPTANIRNSATEARVAVGQRVSSQSVEAFRATGTKCSFRLTHHQPPVAPTGSSLRTRKTYMTFAEAIAAPKAGWKYANDEQMLAALSDALARNCCLNAEQVFDWAKTHSNYRDLLRASQRLIDNAAGMALLIAVLNDQPLGQ